MMTLTVVWTPSFHTILFLQRKSHREKNRPPQLAVFVSRSGAEWKPITADTVTSERHAAANVLNPAPGLTAHAY